MAFGTLGSTLNDELNRLANGGTYRDMDDMVDEALAAKQWANRENIVPYSTDTVGILNEIAALGPNRQNWFDFNGVCNYLAGTTGLPAAAALRQITTTGDILTSLAAFYTDAATPRYNYPGYIYTNGIAGNYISTPDATALDVTGDIDIRVKVAMDDWTPAATSGLVAKWAGSTNFSYFFLVDANGTLGLLYTTDGTAGTFVSKYSTVATGIADGTAKWVRVTRSSSTGNVLFYLSDDGSTWTQLGATVTSTPSSFFSGTANLVLMANSSGGGELAAGKLYNAQIFASINGTDKRFDADLTTNVTSATYDQFTATTGQLCTIFGQNTLTNGGSAGSLLPITVGSSLAADSNDAKFLDHTGTNYVYLPGAANNWLTVPDSNDLDITGDIDIRVQVAMDDWTPAATTTLLSKWLSSQTSYLFYIGTGGNLALYWNNGTTVITKSSTVALSIADGATKWVRVTLDVDNGAAGNDVKFFTSDNGTSWTQLGTTVTTAGVTSIATSTTNIGIGARETGASEVFAGKVYRAQIFNGIDGTKVLDIDTSVITSGADTYVVPTTYTGQTGAYFTGSGLFLNGVSGNYVSTPDSSALDITGDIDIQVKAALTDWTPAAASNIIGKWDPTGNQYSYTLQVNTNGTLQLYWTTSGAAGTVASATSTVATGIADGDTKWIRAALDVNNGASGNTTTFYLSDDGTTWTQLGSPVVNAGVTSIYSGTALLTIGATATGASLTAGTFYRAEILSGINGYPVFDADFTQVPANALRMTESSINKAVVTLNTTRYATINRSTSGRKTVAVTQPTWLFGTDDYMEVNNRYMAHSTSDENYVYLSGAANNNMTVADNPPLDVTGDIDIQIKVAMDDWTPASSSYLLSKVNGGSGNYSYAMQLTATGLLVLAWSSNGTAFINKQSTASVTATDGAPLWVRATLDVDNGAAGNDVKFFTSTDGTTWTQLGSTVTTAGVTSIYSSTSIVEIGSFIGGSPAKGKFYRAIIKNGIDGTTVLDANAAVITLPSQTTFTDSSSNAYTVTINKSGVGTFVSTGNYMYLPGIASNNASAPDSAAVSITGDIDLRIKCTIENTTVANQLIGKTGAGVDSFQFSISVSSGTVQIIWTQADGTVLTSSVTAIAAIQAIGANTPVWIRATLDVDNGAAGNDAKFFTSTDGLTWTQAGTTQTKAGVTNIRDTAALLYVGEYRGSSQSLRGKVFRAQVLNGIGGTLAFDANFEGSITSLNQASFTESSSNAATVTINRSGSTYRSAGVIDAGYLYPGATNTFSNSTTNWLDFGATDSFTLLGITRTFTNAGSGNRAIFSKTISAGTESGYTLANNSRQTNILIRDSSTLVSDASGTQIADGSLMVSTGVVNRSTNIETAYDGVSTNGGTSISTVTGSLTNLLRSFTIGRYANDTNSDMELYAVAVFRSVLTPVQIRQINNYFANREAYL